MSKEKEVVKGREGTWFKKQILLKLKTVSALKSSPSNSSSQNLKEALAVAQEESPSNSAAVNSGGIGEKGTANKRILAVNRLEQNVQQRQRKSIQEQIKNLQRFAAELSERRELILQSSVDRLRERRPSFSNLPLPSVNTSNSNNGGRVRFNRKSIEIHGEDSYLLSQRDGRKSPRDRDRSATFDCGIEIKIEEDIHNTAEKPKLDLEEEGGLDVSLANPRFSQDERRWSLGFRAYSLGDYEEENGPSRLSEKPVPKKTPEKPKLKMIDIISELDNEEKFLLQDGDNEDTSQSNDRSNDDGDAFIVDWSHRFQRVLKEMNKEEERKFSIDGVNATSTMENQSNTRKTSPSLQLLALAQDFLYAAKAYGRIIISEVFSPDSVKTIKPANVGGIAGGAKYIVQGILFKFALDQEGLYGNDHAAAATVAGHELKGMQGYFNCSINGLCLPLMALVDYKGFRLIAISLLPIDKDTIVYGSNDCGNTVHCTDMKANKCMQMAATLLNLLPHPAGLDPVNRVELYSACDLEGHKGRDGRLYLIDFSRTFPCEKPPKIRQPGCNLTQLFRSEFVRSYRTPLCSDAYSAFTTNQYNASIDQATEYLHVSLIPAFGCALPRMIFDAEGGPIAFRISGAVHSKGINVRHLGLIQKEVVKLVRNNGRKVTTITLLMVEMIARTAKIQLRKLLRTRMQQIKKPLEQPFHALVVKFLNNLIGNSDRVETYWNESLKNLLMKKFQDIDFSVLEGEGTSASGASASATPSSAISLTSLSTLPVISSASNAPSFRIQLLKYAALAENLNLDIRLLIFMRMQKMMGFILHPIAERELHSNGSGRQYRVEPILRTDMIDIGERIKHIAIVPLAEGSLMMEKAMELLSSDRANAIQNLTRAIAKFEEVLESNSQSKLALRKCAIALYTLENLMASARSADTSNQNISPRHSTVKSGEGTVRKKKAKEYLLRAIKLDRNDPESLYHYAVLLDTEGDNDEAEEYYLQTLESDPFFLPAMKKYADFLDKKGEKVHATSFMERWKMLSQM